jgi:glycosyltransferase involved in cell wall biosynthesis
MQPFVSVLTPTYNRRKFIPSLIKIYESQTYPKNRMEWIILDDGEEKVCDLFEAASKRIPNIRYYSYDEKMLIGKKRNMLNDLAKGEIIIAMDDDDYYPPDRIKQTV